MCAVARWLLRMSDVSCNQGGGNKRQLTLDRGIGLFLGRDRALGDGDQLLGETVLPEFPVQGLEERQHVGIDLVGKRGFV